MSPRKTTQKKTTRKKTTQKKTTSQPVRNAAKAQKEIPEHTRNLFNGIIANALLSRKALLASTLDGGSRDLNADCGYPDTIEINDYQAMYDREGISKRVVNCLPEESWSVDPEIYETEEAEDTVFEESWKKLSEKMNIFHYLLRADVLSGIGRFGILLLGIDDGLTLDQAVDGVEDSQDLPTEDKSGNGRKLVYLRAFSESAVTITSTETDPTNKRYGKPVMYSVLVSTETEQKTLRVHWTRIIHLADNREDSEVYGVPRMKAVFNRLMDLRKILGGSGEMYWRGAFPGYAFEVNPENESIELDKTAIREEFADFSDHLQRYMAVTGVTVKSLNPQVSSPVNHIEANLKSIAISMAIPFRVLFGSEQAKLASGEDTKRHNTRIAKRENKYVSPMIVRPFVDRLIWIGVLPLPVEDGYSVKWPDLNAPSDIEKADLAVKKTEALSKYIASGVNELIPEAEYMKHFLEMNQEEIDAILEAAFEDKEDIIDVEVAQSDDEEEDIAEIDEE